MPTAIFSLRSLEARIKYLLQCDVARSSPSLSDPGPLFVLIGSRHPVIFLISPISKLIVVRPPEDSPKLLVQQSDQLRLPHRAKRGICVLFSLLFCQIFFRLSSASTLPLVDRSAPNLFSSSKATSFLLPDALSPRSPLCFTVTRSARKADLCRSLLDVSRSQTLQRPSPSPLTVTSETPR